MKVWDMHCDTLAELRYAQQAGKPKSFLHNDLMIDLERMKQGDYLLQCMACFVHLEPEREKSPLLACLEEIDIFYRLLEQYPDDLMQVRTAADYAMLAGHDEVTEEQAQAAAAAFLDLDAARLQATGRSEGAVPCWNFDIDGGDDTSYIAVTVSGGEVLRYYSSCAGGEPVLSTDEAAEAAAAFLRARGYDGMRLIDTEDAGQSLICTFCYVQDGVLCTADQLRVRVRLDDGTVCGFSSASYLDTHRARTLSADTIGAEAGQAAVPGALQVVDTRTAFLRLYGARETLCYEYLCETDDGQRCVIAVNARTGQQERIQTSDVSGGVQMQF